MKTIFTVIMLVISIGCIHAKNTTGVELNAQISKDIELMDSIKQYQQSKAQGSFLLVGGEPNGCDFDNIQDAINSATLSGVGEIRIASNSTYVENLIIDNINITLVGGYDSCFNAGLTGPGSFGPGNFKVDVDGSNAPLPVLRITGASQRNTVVLKNIKFKNGTGGGLQTGGGINAFDANTQILMDNVGIDNNTGSGLGIIGGPNTNNTDIVMTNTTLFFNTASFGGGISCEGQDASIVMESDSGAAFNSATGSGGGAYIVFDCTFSMYSAEMTSNTALNDGGGLFVGSGARVFLIGRKVCAGNTCLGDDVRPVIFNGNQADSDSSGEGNGGALHIENILTFVDMSQVWMRSNSAFHGGAVSLEDNSSMSIDRLAQNCWNSESTNKCNLIESNLASSNNGFGGAIYNNNSQVELYKSYFENNRADFGTAVYAIGNSAITIINGSVFDNNGNNGLGGYADTYVMRATAGAQYLIDYSTFADNHAEQSVFGISSLQNSKLTLRRSIVHDIDSGDVLNDNFGTATFDCILAHEINSISGTELDFGNPQFLDRNNGNYHLNVVSSAIDFCVDSGNSLKDIERDIRGWDDPTRPNRNNNPSARYDVGADESYANDIIFKNSFD